MQDPRNCPEFIDSILKLTNPDPWHCPDAKDPVLKWTLQMQDTHRI